MISEKGSEANEVADEEQERRIILHVYDDESRDFTSLTTYHGMRRIYASANWPSRIFWSLVVVTCLTLFMIHSGLMLFFYNSHPTFIKTLDVSIASKYLPTITICKSAEPTGKSQQLSYQVLNDIPLQENDLNVLQKHSRSPMFEDYWNFTRLPCEGVINRVLIGGRVLTEPCYYAEEVVTDLGYCWAFTFKDVSTDPTDAIDIETKMDSKSITAFQVHGDRSASNMKNKRRYLRKRYKSILSLTITTEKLLHENDWGSCHSEFGTIHFDGQLYQQSECEKNCIAIQYIERCSCVPFHLAKPGVKVCSLAEMHFCKEIARPIQTCDCPLECERLLYAESDLSFVRIKSTEISVLRIEFPSYKVQTLYQLKRIKAVDLLIWGVFNDKRHKSYWDNIMGDEDGNQRRKSYEQIVITTKTGKTDDETSRPVIEENYAVLTNPMTRRTSVIRIGPQYPVSNESRSRSNTGNTQESGSGALTIRLMRKPSIVAGRRRSLYNAFGNF